MLLMLIKGWLESFLEYPPFIIEGLLRATQFLYIYSLQGFSSVTSPVFSCSSLEQVCISLSFNSSSSSDIFYSTEFLRSSSLTFILFCSLLSSSSKRSLILIRSSFSLNEWELDQVLLESNFLRSVFYLSQSIICKIFMIF